MECGAGWCVTAVSEDVDNDFLDTALSGHVHDLKHVITMRVHPFVLQQAHQVEPGVVRLAVLDQAFEVLGFEE
jgi:hypothetical protein